MRPRTNAKKVKARAKAKAKAKAKVQAEADENKPTFDVDESVAAAVPEKSASFDALPEELQLKILRLALFLDAEEDVETQKNALRVETLKQPAVVPKRADEKPLYDDGYDPVPMGIWRGTCALLTYARLSCVSKGVGTLARDERLWAEPLALIEEFYPGEEPGSDEPSDSPDVIEDHGDAGSDYDSFSESEATFLYEYPDDWSWHSSYDKYRWIVPRARRAIKDFLRGCARVSEDVAKDLAGFDIAPPFPTSLERTDKPPPEDCYQEVFTRDVTTRLLFNEYGSGIRPDESKEIFHRIILAEARHGHLFAPIGINAVAFDDASYEEYYRGVQVNFFYGELVDQGYFRWKDKTMGGGIEPKYLN